MEAIIGIILSVSVGFVIGYFCKRATNITSIGDLIADNTDPDGIYFFLKLNAKMKPEEIMEKKYVVLQVKKQGYFHS